MSGFFAGSGSSRLTLTSRHPCLLGSFTIPEIKYALPRITKFVGIWDNGVTCDLNENPFFTVKYTDFIESHGLSEEPDDLDVEIVYSSTGKVDVGQIGGEFFTLPVMGAITPILSYSDGIITWAYGIRPPYRLIQRDDGSWKKKYTGWADYGLQPGNTVPSVTINYGAK